MSTSMDSGSAQRQSRQTGLEEQTSGGSSLTDTTPKSDLLVTDLDLHINKTFKTAIAHILSTNDIYGSRVMREVVLDELGDLCRFTKKLCRSQSVEMPQNESKP